MRGIHEFRSPNSQHVDLSLRKMLPGRLSNGWVKECVGGSEQVGPYRSACPPPCLSVCLCECEQMTVTSVYQFKIN